MQLQNSKARFKKQGIELAAISYDSPAILRDFSKRHNIDFPLLADSDSKVIRSFDVLNAEARGMTEGMAHPGFFYIDENGVIREKYFEAQYTNRYTANNVIGKLSPELAEEVPRPLETPHLRLTVSQSDRVVVPGSRVTLVAEVELPPDVHVYSPGVRCRWSDLGICKIYRRRFAMKKTMVGVFTVSLMSLVAAGFAAARPQSQADPMKHDDMKKDDMSQDSMSKDKMSHEMAKAKTFKGWVTDSECAAHGEKKCGNKEHVAQGAKLVLVTDGDNKIWTVANPETLAEHQGHHVEVKATTDTEKGTVNVQEVKMLKQGK